jgi:hypothetical protein
MYPSTFAHLKTEYSLSPTPAAPKRSRRRGLSARLPRLRLAGAPRFRTTAG